MSPSHTFYRWIRCLACRGIASGYPCGGPSEPCNATNDPYFRPGRNITRAQVSKLVALAAGYTQPIPAGQQTFEDVLPTSTFFVWIENLASSGTMSGYPCGLVPDEPCMPPRNRPYFRPNNNASRGQLSKIVSNAARFSEPVSGQTFEDVPPEHPFYVWIGRLVSRGIMEGYPCGTTRYEPCIPPLSRPYFRPYNLVTRGQASKIVSNSFFPGCGAMP